MRRPYRLPFSSISRKHHKSRLDKDRSSGQETNQTSLLKRSCEGLRRTHASDFETGWQVSSFQDAIQLSVPIIPISRPSRRKIYGVGNESEASPNNMSRKVNFVDTTMEVMCIVDSLPSSHTPQSNKGDKRLSKQ